MKKGEKGPSGIRIFCLKLFTQGGQAWAAAHAGCDPAPQRSSFSKGGRLQRNRWSASVEYAEGGQLKDMSFRFAMLRMQDDGLLQLPPPQNRNNNGKPYRRRTLLAEPGPQLVAASPKELGDLELQLVTQRHDSHLHNNTSIVTTTLATSRCPGPSYGILPSPLAASSPCSDSGLPPGKTQPRDHFIGWTPQQREQRLHLVTNNARFFI